MSKKKRNRDLIMEQSIYDLLCKMNERAMPKICVLGLLGDKRGRCERYTCKSSELGCMKRCNEEYKCCKECIADWLNEFRSEVTRCKQ